MKLINLFVLLTFFQISACQNDDEGTDESPMGGNDFPSEIQGIGEEQAGIIYVFPEGPIVVSAEEEQEFLVEVLDGDGNPVEDIPISVWITGNISHVSVTPYESLTDKSGQAHVVFQSPSAGQDLGLRFSSPFISGYTQVEIEVVP